MMPRVATLVFAAVLITGVLSTLSGTHGQENVSQRKWKDDTGRFEIVATYQSSDDTNVTLKKADGTLVRVPLARLSAEDRKHLESLTSKNPFVDVVNPPTAVDDAVVRVIFRMPDGSEVTTAGLVFHWDAKKAYVLTDAQHPVGNMIRTLPAAVSIIRDATDEPRHVAAELVTMPERNGNCIVGAPLADLPGPLQWANPADIREGTPVAISAYDIDRGMQGNSYARVRASATINKIYRSGTNEIMKWGIDGPDLGKVRFGVASLANGKVLGPLQSESAGVGFTTTIVTTAGLQFAKQPKLAKIDFEPVSGDVQKVRYGFLVSVVDPFQLLKSSKLSITPLFRPLPGGFAAPGGFGGNPARGAPGRPEVIERDLAPGTNKDALVAKFGAERRQTPNVRLFVAYLEEANTGPNQQPQFDVSLTGKLTDGKPLSLSSPGTTRVSFSIPQRGGLGQSMIPNGSAISNIPGLDGYPLDMPRPTRHAKGGWQVTSDLSRVKDAPPSSSRDFPQPEAGKPAAESRREKESGPLKWTLLPFSAAQGAGSDAPRRQGSGMFGGSGTAVGGFARGATHRPMAYSHDGKWLYLVDGNKVLRKLDAVTLDEAVSLNLQQVCNHLAISRAGLVASLPSARAIWVLDPQSLKVKREIALAEVLFISAAPATDIGFVVTFPEDNISSPTQLFMLDLAKGEQLHVLKSYYAGTPPQSIQIDNKSIFTSRQKPTDLAQTPDGKTLLFGNNKLCKFRVEGTDLVFEQATTDQQMHGSRQFVLGVDGKRLLARADTGNISDYSIGLFDVADVSKPLSMLSGEIKDLQIGFDPKTQNVYSPMRGLGVPGSPEISVPVFGADGSKLAVGSVPDEGPWRILVHPQGERFVLWSNKKIFSVLVGPVSGSSKGN